MKAQSYVYHVNSHITLLSHHFHFFPSVLLDFLATQRLAEVVTNLSFSVSMMHSSAFSLFTLLSHHLHFSLSVLPGYLATQVPARGVTNLSQPRSLWWRPSRMSTTWTVFPASSATVSWCAATDSPYSRAAYSVNTTSPKWCEGTFKFRSNKPIR